MRQTFAVGIGGATGQGVATPGDIFAKIFSRRGLHLNAYNAYQSITFPVVLMTKSTGCDVIAQGCKKSPRILQFTSTRSIPLCGQPGFWR